MKKQIFSLISILSFAFLINATATTAAVTRIEVESMQLTGCVGTLSAQALFAGLRFYCNNDLGKAALSSLTIPSRYLILVKGASTNATSATISIYLGSQKVGSCAFTSTTPTLCSLYVDLEAQPSPLEIRLQLETDNGSNDTDIDYVEIVSGGTIPPPPPAPVVPSIGSYTSKKFRNLFKESGRDSAAIVAKVSAAWQQLFYGDSANQRVYYPVGTDMAYIKDVGNGDVRSEGMSYGMMICVQLNKKAEFDRLWKWAKTYMYHSSGDFKGYYSWQVSTAGSSLDNSPAPDGEEYFAMALFFAAHRWGNGTGIFNYKSEANILLDAMLHHEEQVSPSSGIKNMINAVEKKIVFSPNNSSALFTDPSYHLPAFYDLWAQWAEKDNAHWAAVADTSRVFFARTTNATTGLGPDYAEFSGAPNNNGSHGEFRFDAWRIAQNIAIDYAWWTADPWQKTYADRIQQFFESKGISSYGNQYSLAGTALSTDHSPGLVAMNAVASLAATNVSAWKFVDELWNVAIPIGQWRYYDGMLYMLGLLHVSGNFKIYDTEQTSVRTANKRGALPLSRSESGVFYSLAGERITKSQLSRMPAVLIDANGQKIFLAKINRFTH